MKKIISMILALMLVVSLAVSASATTMEGGGTATSGTITITGVSKENVYSIYKMMTLESYNNTEKAYSYKLTDDNWREFFAPGGAGAAYITVDASDYATWTGSNTPEAVETFSELALAYAESKDIAPDHVASMDSNPQHEAHFVTDTDGTVSAVFKELPLGYYLIDSTMGALCGLTTTVPDVIVNAKNSAPTIDKQVMDGNNAAEQNVAGIGDVVYYQVKVSVTGGAQNYALHDVMTPGLTFNEGSVAAILNGETVTNTNNAAFKVFPAPTADDKVCNHDGGFCTFVVKFTDAFCETLENGDNLVITYNATLNQDAEVGSGAYDVNSAMLEFGEDHFTTVDSVKTYTYGMEIVKTDDTGTKLLDGAEFYIYDSLTDGKIIPVVKVTDEKGTYYRVAVSSELDGKPNGDIIDVNKHVKVMGFGNGTYYLQEEKQPDGYNLLAARHPFTINNADLYATFVDNVYSAPTGVQVVNKTGTVLPSTGAMGTTMFLTFGSIVVMAAGVLLVTKKRMTMIEE